MEIFTFLFIYFIVSSSIAMIVYAAFLLLQRYADLIQRSDQSKVVVLALLLATSLTFQWYAVSSTLVMFNKWFMTRWRGGGFGFPLLTTCIHMLVKLCVTRIWLWYSSATEPTPTDDWYTYLTLVVPIGICTVVDIALSNQALIYIPVALYTTIKSSSLVFVFLFGVLLGLEPFRWPTFLCVIALASGLGLAVLSSTQISTFGVSLCLGASVTGGLRWALMHYLAERDRTGNHVLAVLYKISPVALITLLPVALTVEGKAALHSPLLDGGTGWFAPIEAFSLCLMGGTLATALIFSEITLLNTTSSLTFSVLGQVKEMIQIVLAMMVFNENLSARAIVGIACSFLAAAYYRRIKVAELAEQVEEVSSSGPGPSPGFGLKSRDYHYTAANEGEGLELGTYSDREGKGRGSGGIGGGSVELLLPKGREAIASRARAELSLGFEDDDYVVTTTTDHDISTANSSAVRVGMSGSSGSNVKIGTGGSPGKKSSSSKSGARKDSSSPQKGSDGRKGTSTSKSSHNSTTTTTTTTFSNKNSNNNSNDVDLDMGDLEDFLQVDMEDYR